MERGPSVAASFSGADNAASKPQLRGHVESYVLRIMRNVAQWWSVVIIML